MRRLLVVVALVLQISACAGLMMHVDELDASAKDIHLNKGSKVQLDLPNASAILKGNETPTTHAIPMQLRAKIKKELAAAGVVVVDRAPAKLHVQLQHYEAGSAFCRGFFPFFGLGDTFFDGTATLTTAAGTRTLVIKKTGQAQGMAEMSDQTDTNMEYFAKVVATNLVRNGKIAKAGK